MKPSAAFGHERTAKEHRDRADWEREQAARLRAEARERPPSELMVGHEHVVQGHEDTARAYEKRAREIESEMVETARRGEARGKSRAELVDVARAAAAAVFDKRKVAPSDAAIVKAKEAAFKAIRRADPSTGTARPSGRTLLVRCRRARGRGHGGGTSALADAAGEAPVTAPWFEGIPVSAWR